MRRLPPVLVLLAAAGCGNGGGPALVATDAEVTAPMPGMSMSAGYLSLANNGDEPLRITAVASPQFARVEMHENVYDNDIVRMRKLDSLLVRPGDEVVLEPGGRHLMLMQPAGRFDTVRLDFYAGDDLLLTVDAPVRER